MLSLSGRRYFVVEQESAVTSWRLLHLILVSQVASHANAVALLVVVVMAVCVFVAGVVALYSFRGLYAPTRQLCDAMNRFGAGELAVRMNKTRKDEIGKLFYHFNGMADRIQQMMTDTAEHQRQRRKLEIQFLQAQIMPHFLSNTLTSVKSLAHLGRMEEIPEIMTSLIDLLKLVNYQGTMIPLSQGMKYVLGYVKIMRMRRQLPVVIENRISREAGDCLIPKFTLQPIVENCLLHAFQNNETPGTITISGEVGKACLTIALEDNGAGMDEETLARLFGVRDNVDKHQQFSHIGVANVRERLRLIFGESCEMIYESEKNKGTVVRIVIPVQLERDESQATPD